jgi:acetyl esterase
MAVGGDSAGGTLATVCATLARDAGLPLRLQLLFYPGCAPPAGRLARPLPPGPGAGAGPHRILLPPVRGRREREDWRFAPLNTPDLEGVAPAWFGLAECDPLVDDGLAYADKLRAAGVPVDLEIYRGVTHEFIKMGRALPEARQAHADAAAALKKALFAA